MAKAEIIPPAPKPPFEVTLRMDAQEAIGLCAVLGAMSGSGNLDGDPTFSIYCALSDALQEELNAEPPVLIGPYKLELSEGVRLS